MARNFEDLTVKELRGLAKRGEISDYSKLKKDELVKLLKTKYKKAPQLKASPEKGRKTFFKKLPKELHGEQLYQLSGLDLLNACKEDSPIYHERCEDEEFWKN